MKLILLLVVLWTTTTQHTYGFKFSTTIIKTHIHKYAPPILAINRNYRSLKGSANNGESTNNNADDNIGYEIDPSFSYSDDPNSPPIFYNEDEEGDCLPPGRIPTTKMVMLISDSTGQTVKSAFGKSLAQFETCDNPNLYLNSPNLTNEDYNNNIGDCNVQTRQFTFIRSEAALASIVKKAAEKKALVMFTFADSALQLQAERMCQLSNVPNIDLLGPTLSALSELLGKTPVGLPGVSAKNDRKAGVKLSDSYYRRIEAVEFTLKADDGQSPWLLPEADVVLVGVSRTGKTPLSVVMSQTLGLKVANVPLVMECEPPEVLLKEGELDSKRVFCLTIAPSELRKIRTVRLERQFESLASRSSPSSSSEPQSMAHTSNYADRAYLLNDLKNARSLAEKCGWTEIDVTGRAVEETAGYIAEIMNERFGKEMD